MSSSKNKPSSATSSKPKTSTTTTPTIKTTIDDKNKKKIKPTSTSLQASTSSNTTIDNNQQQGTSSGENKLSKEEKELFMKCAQAEQRTLSHEELQAAMPKLDIIQKMNIANSLIARGMLQIKRIQDELFYVAVDKTQQKVNSNMTQDEKLVYDNISSSGNTGIWTKTLKMRTNIHQSNITKCIKSLESKNLIKSVKSVKFPTRKIYMLFDLQPSIELSGGPWYTDNELDTEFINVLLRGIHRFLEDKSYPTATSSCKNPIYPISHTPYLPTTVHDVLTYLKQSHIVQEGTDLTTEHILTLLDVLIYDGVVERITVGTAKCEGENEEMMSETQEEEEEEEDSKDYQKRIGGSLSNPISKKQKTNDGKVNKKKIRFDDEDRSERSNSAEEEAEDDDDETEKRDKSKQRRNKRRWLPNHEAFVYRALKPLESRLEEEEDKEEQEEQESEIKEVPKSSGFYDMPCGHCPSFEFCSSKGKSWQFKGSTNLGDHHPTNLNGLIKLPKLGLAGIGSGFNSLGGLGIAGGVAPVNPTECVYFTEWLDF